MGQVELRMGFWRIVAVAVLLGMVAGTAVAQSGVTVSGVTAAQRNDNSKLVDIYYNLSASGPCTVWPVISADGGVTWNVPAQTFTGALGGNISPGSGRHMVWDAGADIPGKIGSFRARVFADDGSAMTNMVLVPGGTFPYQNNFNAQIFVPTFLIDKYEVTNQHYAEFLNDADPNGSHWDTQQEITRNGTPPTVFYAPWPGKQNYPVRWVSALDAEAYAAWLSVREDRSFRLPTDREWEKAAAWDPTLNKHWLFSSQSDSHSCNAMNCGFWYCGGSGCYVTSCIVSPTEVGHYNGMDGTIDGRSPYGCYDMSGNVWEWTSESSGLYGTIRGGAFLPVGSIGAMTIAACQTSHGFNWQLDDRNHTIGFRLVLDAQ